MLFVFTCLDQMSDRMPPLLKTRRFWEAVVLLIVWALITAVNLNKAFHIDDTAHLEIARWILNHPLRPMSGLVNWSSSSQPIHLLNQPHLYFYLLALWGRLFGFGELSMHLLQSLFSLACIILAYAIAQEFNPSRGFVVALLFAVNPAFVVGQNLMTDVPLLSLWLAFFFCLTTRSIRSESRRFTLAAVFASLACLIKYTSVVLIVIMAIILLVRRRRSLLLTLLIPVLTLAAWSLFNLYDYGGVHILGRPAAWRSASAVLAMLLTYLVCIGAVMPASFLYYSRPLRLAGRRLSLLPLGFFLLLLCAVLITSAFMGWLPAHQIDVGLAFVFLCNGLMMALMMYLAFKADRTAQADWSVSRQFVLYLWIILGSLFIVAFAPFMATRHALLIVFPVTLLLAANAEARYWRVVDLSAVAGGALLTLMLAISDNAWANYYRVAAGVIRQGLPADARVYFSGHWGWQWYAAKSGMRQFDQVRSELRPGDFLVAPVGIDSQSLNGRSAGIKLVEFQVFAPPVLRPKAAFSTRGAFAGFYYLADYLTPPWTVSRNPHPPIVVFKAQAAP